MSIDQALDTAGDLTDRQCKHTLVFLLGLLADQDDRRAIRPDDVRGAVAAAVGHGKRVAA